MSNQMSNAHCLPRESSFCLSCPQQQFHGFLRSVRTTFSFKPKLNNKSPSRKKRPEFADETGNFNFPGYLTDSHHASSARRDQLQAGSPLPLSKRRHDQGHHQTRGFYQLPTFSKMSGILANPSSLHYLSMLPKSIREPFWALKVCQKCP